MAHYKYVSVNRIFSKLIRDFTDSFSEDDVIEWIGEALEFMQCAKSFEEAVAFIEVKNHQCNLPKNLHAVIQIAKSNLWTNECKTPTPAKVIEETQNLFYSDCAGCGDNYGKDSGYIVLDGRGSPLVEYDVAYYRPYFDLLGEYYGWSNSKYYGNSYSPVRLKNHTFFNSLVCTERTSTPYNSNCNDEYTIVGGSILRFSFESGFVAVAYLRPYFDPETGYPMVPDSISHTTAITKYVTMKVNDREFQNGRQGADSRLARSEADWQWYCKQASNEDMMPYGIDEYQNFLDQRSYLVPQLNNYYGFFGNLSKPEDRSRIHAERGYGHTALTQIQNEYQH